MRPPLREKRGVERWLRDSVAASSNSERMGLWERINGDVTGEWRGKIVNGWARRCMFLRRASPRLLFFTLSQRRHQR